MPVQRREMKGLQSENFTWVSVLWSYAPKPTAHYLSETRMWHSLCLSVLVSTAPKSVSVLKKLANLENLGKQFRVRGPRDALKSIEGKASLLAKVLAKGEGGLEQRVMNDVVNASLGTTFQSAIATTEAMCKGLKSQKYMLRTLPHILASRSGLSVRGVTEVGLRERASSLSDPNAVMAASLDRVCFYGYSLGDDPDACEIAAIELKTRSGSDAVIEEIRLHRSLPN